jgi:hypothetical protein
LDVIYFFTKREGNNFVAFPRDAIRAGKDKAYAFGGGG